MEIGEKLKELRLKNDLTLSELASRSEVTKGFLSQLERDLTSPNVTTLENILEALGTIYKLSFPKSQRNKLYLKKKIILSMKEIMRRSNGLYPMRKKIRWNQLKLL